MKAKKNNIYAIVLLASFLFCCLSYDEGKAQTYGGEITVTKVTPIKDVLAAPKSFTEKTVSIEGKITAVCPSGCWFDITDGNVEIHVDIRPSGFVIPQITGKTAKVEGNTRIKEGGKIDFVGKGVQIR
jgi:hypothetical protein